MAAETTTTTTTTATEMTPVVGEMGVTDSPQPTSTARSYFEKLRSLVTVEVVFFLYFFGAVSYNSCLQQYVFDRISQEHDFVKDDDQDSCKSDNHTQEYNDLSAKVQAESSRFMTLQSAVSLVPGLVMTLFLGHYSDHAGRKIVMLPAVASAGIRAFLTILVAGFNANIYYLLIPAFLDAFTGSSTAVVMAAFAYVTDISPPERRTLRLLMVEIGLVGGIALAGTATGSAIKTIGYLTTFLLPAAAHAVNTLYVAFYLKETRETKKGVRFFTLQHLKGSVKLFYPFDDSPMRVKLYFIAAFIVLYVMVEMGTNDINTFYLLGAPVCFESDSLGTYNTVNTVIRFFGAWAGAKLVLTKVGVTGMLTLCCVFGCLSDIVMGLLAATNRYLVYLVPFLGSLSTLGLPIARAWASKLVAPEQFGTLFAALSFCQQLAQFLGTTIFNAIFSQTVGFYAGFVFFICALVFAINTVVSGCLHVVVKRQQVPSEPLENEQEPPSVNAQPA